MRPQFVDMEGWTLLSADRQVMPHTHRAEAELLHADLRTLAEDSFPELYWQAPPSYLGDRVSRDAGPGAWRGGGRGALWGWRDGEGPGEAAHACQAAEAAREERGHGHPCPASPPAAALLGIFLRGDPPLPAALGDPAWRRLHPHRKPARRGAAGGIAGRRGRVGTCSGSLNSGPALTHPVSPRATK